MMLSRAKIWYRLVTHPMTARLIVAGAVEVIGVGLVLYGVYLIHELAFIIVLGSLCLLLAQGLTRKD
jgi:hypothetical protein